MMSAYPNHTKQQLAAGKIAVGMGLRLARTVDIATIGKTCGYDWLFIDMEHNSMDVDTAIKEAERAVAYCKYPPIGHRSVMGVLPQFGYRNLPVAESAPIANAQTMVIIMLETPDAIAQADAFAAVPGVDSILIGTNDLCAEMGIPGQFTDPRVEDAYRKVIAACRKNNIHPGMGGVYEPKLLEKYIGMGMRFILGGGDMSFLMAGARDRASFLHGLKL